VAIDEHEFHGAFAGGDVVHTFTVFVIVGRSSDRAGMATMESFMSQSGDQSIRAAIEADPTLGGVVSTSLVSKSGPPTAIQIANGPAYISVPFAVEVHA
jgi:mannose/fructose/N-acetylgalactosamine-specific phosphotransferase system component IIC